MRKYAVILAGVVLVLCIGMVAWLYHFSGLKVVNVPAPEPVIHQQAQPTSAGRGSVSPSPDNANDSENAPGSANSQPQQPMQDMASRQRTILSYPEYSQPFAHTGDAFANWNRTYPVEIPVLEGAGTMSLQLRRYHHIYPQAIEGELSASVPLHSVRIELVDVASGAVLHSEQGDGQFAISSEADWPRELRVRAEVSFQGTREQLSTDLNFHYPSATIEAVGEARIAQQNVVTQVTVYTEQSGIFRLRAILEGASGNRLAVLTARERLSQGRQTMQLRAHHSVLPDEAVELFLTNPVIERMSSHPGEQQNYGQSEQQRWPLGQVNPAMLDTAPYEPTESEQRQLEFLRGWGG